MTFQKRNPTSAYLWNEWTKTKIFLV